MSYPQQYPPQGYAAPGQPMPQQFGQQAYADPNTQQYPPAPPQGYGQPQAPNPYGVPQQFAQQAPPQGYPAQQPMPDAPDVEDTSGMFGGAPAISWDVAKGYVIGTPRGGQIIAKKITQQTNAETKAPRFYEGSGKPMMQIVVTLQTRERTDATDDGKRNVYVKGEMLKTARQSFEAKGARDLEIGGWFYAANTSKTGGRNGKANTFDCVYARPGEPDPLAHLPAYVAPQMAAPQAPAQPQFVPPQQPSYPQPGQQQNWNPYAQGQPQQPPAAQYGAPQQAPPAQPQGNPYGYGHQPPASPGGQAYAAAQQPAQGQMPQSGYPQSAFPPHTGHTEQDERAQQFAQQQGAPGGPPAGYNPF